jgi:hypothetical protein
VLAAANGNMHIWNSAINLRRGSMNNISGVVGIILLALMLTGCEQFTDTSSGAGTEGDSEGGGSASVSSGDSSASERETSTVSEPADKDEPREKGDPVVTLDPDDASLEGAAQYFCKEPYGCWWLVHCGHAICDGSWNWKFASEGTYRLNWRGVQQKCAGSPPYQIRINDKVVTSGEIPQYGSCDECGPVDVPNIFVNQGLGTFDIEEGDKVTLWIETEFSCGIDGPGAYGAFDDIVAELVE